MKTKFALVLMLCVFVTSNAFAENTPKIVVSAFDTYKTLGYDEAFNVLLKGSPLESDKTTMMNLKGGFTQIEAMYGKMIGYEILKSVLISTSTNRTYAELRYEKGPVFVLIDSYKSPKGWIVPIMKFHTEAEKVFPENLISIK